MKPRSTFSQVLLWLIVTIGLGACSQTTPVELNLAPESELPAFVDRSAPQVKEAYRFAIANPEILSAVPCYCGCGALGHQNNLQCYIKEFRADGSIEFETHGFGWGICVDITRDVMRSLQAGKELKEIRAGIDADYSRYGPPTDTEPIE